MSLCLVIPGDHPYPGSAGRRRARYVLLLTLILAAIMLSSCASSAQNPPSSPPGSAPTGVIQDGDFETPVVNQNLFSEFNAGQTFGSWMVKTGSIDLIGKGYWLPEHGNQSVDLDGSAPGTIYQDVPTSSSKRYTISFYLAGNPVCGAAVMQMQIMWGTVRLGTVSFDTTGHSATNMGWKQYSYSIGGGSPTTRLLFTSLTGTLCGPALDNVTVTG